MGVVNTCPKSTFNRHGVRPHERYNSHGAKGLLGDESMYVYESRYSTCLRGQVQYPYEVQ